MPNKQNDNIHVLVYGFDRLDFPKVDDPINGSGDIMIEFIPFNSSLGIQKADGVIIPQGIFERITYNNNHVSGLIGEVSVSKNAMLDIEREVNNCLEEGKWVCFLVDEIVDQIPRGYNKDPMLINDTDLCKRVLKNIGVARLGGFTETNLLATNEFQSYIKKYGVAKTSFSFAYDNNNYMSKLVTSKNDCVGFEYNNRLFFLPFHITKKDNNIFKEVVSLVAKSVTDYRKKHEAILPKWANEIKFKKEVNLHKDIVAQTEKVDKLKTQLDSFSDYKLILSTSGAILRNKAIKIFDEFFDLNIDPIDENLEDAKILDDQGVVNALIEIKGTNKGIKREHINQVDSHRERNELNIETPGVLLINNEMKVERIQQRLETKIPSEHIKHAKNLNILIIRTIDFLFLMKHLEDNANKKNEIMKLIKSGGGWLKADQKGYTLVSE